ncbi:MAG: toll/interleukin-1 receptor domain-containing protein [Pseudomonadota bacterium]
MADIFISYKKEDAGRVVRIVEGLRAEGFSVWWDHGIAPGSQWDSMIQKELQAAKCVVAVWSELSVSAPWVKEEAGVGKDRGALVPIRIDDVPPPLGFGLIQAADLWDWNGDIDDPHWDFFIASVKAIVSGESAQSLEKPAKRRKVPFVPVLVLLAALVVLGGGALWGASNVFGSNIAEGDGLASAPQSRPSDAEQTLFAQAQESQLKTDYQDYLRSFPQGYYAKRIREEILPICEGVMRPVWQQVPTPLGQMFRSVSPTEDLAGNQIAYDTREEACAAAQADFERSADSYCRAFTNTLNSRNEQLGIDLADCECQNIQGDWFCLTDSTYSCTYEFETEQFVEICG